MQTCSFQCKLFFNNTIIQAYAFPLFYFKNQQETDNQHEVKLSYMIQTEIK